MSDRLYLEVNGTDVDEDWGDPVVQDQPTEDWGDPVAENPAAPVVAAAIKSNPDQAARARAISQQTQVPADIVERNLPEMEQRVRAEQVSQIAQQDPAIEKALTDPETAKIAHDDVENLSLAAQIGRAFLSVPRAIGAAVPRVNAGLWGVARAAADIVGADDAVEFAKARQEEQKGFAEIVSPKTGNWALDAANSGLTSFAQSMLMAPFGSVGILTSFGLVSGGDAYGEARDAGKGVAESLAFGGAQAGVEMITERLPVKHLMDAIGGRQALLPALKRFAVSEGIGEQIATLWQDFNEWVVLNPEKTVQDFLVERPGRAAETLISTIVSVGASSTIAHSVDAVRERGQRAQQAQQATKAVADLTAASESSKLRARDPEAFKRFMADAMTDETGDRPDLYIDGQFFAQALESAGLPLERLAQVAPNLAQQVAEATQLGGDVVLPADEFASTLAGTPLAPALLPHLRTSPDAMSVAEAEVFAQNEPVLFQQATEQAIAQTVAEAADRADQDTVYTEILNRLNRAGRFTEDVNRAYATVPTAIIKTMAARMGMTATDFADRWMPRVVSENPAAPGEVLNDRGFDYPVVNIGLATNDGGAITADEAIAALRSIGVEVVETAQHESDTEQTLVARLSRPLTPEEGEALSVALRQDAVAQAFGTTGDLFGPKKDDWGPFNPQFFLTLDGRRASESELLNQTPGALPLWSLERAKGARISAEVKKGSISLAPKATLARKNYEKLDAIFAKVPNPLESEESWRKWMSLLVADRDVLGVPYTALKYAQSPEAVAEYLSRLRPDQLESRRAGFELGARIRQEYVEGRASPIVTGRLLLWAMLSRKAGAYPHEAAYMDLVNGGVDQWIEKAVNGTWTQADSEAYVKWSSDFMASKKGGASPGAGVTSNANDFGRILLTKMSEKDANGETQLTRLHNLIADPNVSTSQVRREFFALGDALGIQNKVLSFALLVTGRWDTLVLDRVQFTHLWGDQYRERAGQRNIYDNGLAAAGEGHFGLAVYEALERGMSESLRKGYALAGLTGPGDGTLGAFHWDSWLIESSQAIGHPTVEALDTERPRPDLAVRQGKFDTYSYNFEYRADGQYQIPFLDGSGYVILSPAEASEFQRRLGDPNEGVVPKDFKVSQNKQHPWVDAEGVNRGRYDEILAGYGRRADAGDVAPAGSADASGPLQQPAADGVPEPQFNQDFVDRPGSLTRRTPEFPRIDSFRGLKLRRSSADIRVSAASAFADGPFTIQPGVREIPLADVTLQDSDVLRSEPEQARIAALAEAIKKNGSIEPLFVAQRADGSRYVAEGQHRARALRLLGYDSIPARVMVEGAGFRAPDLLMQSAPPTRRTPEFEQWFAGSKVVDENGEPLVVYHGSLRDFDAFDMNAARDGAHFFTPLSQHAAFFGDVRGFYVSIKNPLVISQDDLNAAWDAEHPDGEQDDRSLLPRDFVKDFVARAKAGGHDGLVIEQFGDLDYTTDVYLPFDANQIKSVDNTAPTSSSNVYAQSAPPSRTPEFEQWFAGSKVVNENGEPLRAYHATTETFDAFRETGTIGSHFGTDKAAHDRLTDLGKRREKADRVGGRDPVGGNVLPVYLSIKNPLRADDVGNWQDAEDVAGRLAFNERLPAPTREALSALSDKLFEVRKWHEDDPVDPDMFTAADGTRRPVPEWADGWTVTPENLAALEQIRAMIEEAGFDGIVYSNAIEGGGADSYIAFRANQIKSVFNARPTNAPGLLMQSAPPTKGIHFSNGVRTVLDGRYYGRGMKGDEAARLANATDRRIRDRVYVYIDRGQGILPEQGVGGFAHEVDLPPLYDASRDPLGLKRGVDANTFESRVLDAGYAGYWVEGFTATQDAAVIMGPASHGLAARAVPPPARPGGVAIAVPQKYTTALTSKEIEIVRDNFEALRDEVPSIKERFGTLSMEAQDLPAAIAALSKLGVQLPGEPLQQAVWHGSPHSVVRFSFDFIGTGEGAQAFGWGLYFAENRDTAKFYHSILAGLPPVRRIKLGTLTFGEFDGFDYSRKAHLNDVENIRAALAERVQMDTKSLWEGREDFQQVVLDELALLEGFENGERTDAYAKLRAELSRPGAVDLQFAEAEGAVYKLEIPDEAIERMMLWDKPLSEQPESVRKILERVRAETGATYTDRASGESILLLLGKALEGQNDWTAGERDKAAALYLAAAGIPGNRYLDGMSRAKGEGHHNIVVWDQALLDVMNEQVEAQLPQQTSNAPRGTFNPSTNTIALLERADLSTFLHETGHWALEMLVDLAAQPGAPTQVVDDARTLLAWAGVESLQAWQKMSLEQRRAAHEKVAEGFETYLFEGNAPSAELQGAFARFRAWMLNVYKSLTRMRVQLTPEVRSVFDRMLATDEQIAEMSRVREMAPMFESAEAAGMTPEDFAAYLKLGEKAANDATADLTARTLRDMKWLSNAKGRALKKLQDSAKEIRKGIRAEVETEVDAQPVYAAIAFIEKGVMAERDLTNAQRKALESIAGGKTKLDLTVLKELYGEDPAAPWRYLKQTLVAAQDGAHPDAVAEAFGFDSGDALVRAILAAEPRQQLVEGLTDQRMLERHGDLADSESMERAAEMAIHNEARTRFVATEMRTLAEALNPREKVGETKVTTGKFKGQTRSLTVNALMRAAKSYADQIVARTVVRKLSPARHASTAAKEARAAREALAAGKIELALQHKRNQLLHERTSRAMADAQIEFEKMQAYLRKFRNNRARGAIDADYVEQIENVLAAVDTRNATNKRLDSLQSLREWKAAQEEQGLPVVLDPDLVATMNVTNLRDMTMEQLRGLVDQVKSIEHLGKLKKKLLTARDQREFEAIRDEVAATIRANGGKPRDVPFNPSAHDQAWWKSWRGFFAEHRKFASLVRQFDGVVDNGPIWRILVRGMNDAGNREQALLMDATKKLGAIFAPLEKMKGGLTGDKRLITSLGKSLTRGDRIAVALNWGNELNRSRVLNTLTQPQVDEIFSMLTREEWTAVQAIWDHLNEYWPDIAAKEKRVTGTAPEKVESAPFTVTLQDGSTVDLAGGYYPIAYESELSDVAAAHQQAQIAKDMMAGAYTRATTRRGHTKKRAQNVSEPLTWSLTVIDRHVNQVVHDLAWHEWLIDANRVLRDREVAGAIRAHYGNETLRTMKQALQDIAVGDLQTAGAVGRLVAGLRARASAATMGWSITTALLQPFGILQSIPRVGSKWILKGMRHWAGDLARFENSAAKIREKSPMMRHRTTTFNRDIREVMGRVHRGDSKAKQVFDASLFFAMQKLQLMADVPTWWGAYEKALADGVDEDTAVALADQAVIDAQGSGMTKDLAGVQRGGELQKAMSMFYSYFSATWNMMSESTARTDFRNPVQVAGWLADMAALVVVPALGPAVLLAALQGGDDDEDKETGEILADAGLEVLGFLMGTLIGVREFSGFAKGYSYSGPAFTRAIKDVGDAASKSLPKVVDEDEELEETDYRRIVKAFLVALGLPATQVDRSWRGWRAWQEGEAGPAAILVGPPPKD